MKLNITILYQSYGKSYGHTRMAHNLALAALKQGHRAQLINSGVLQKEFLFHSDIECHTITDFDRIYSKIVENQTHVLITEFFPFGRAGLRPQMREMFARLRQSLPQLKIISSMREFMGRAPDPREPSKLEKHARRISYDLEEFYDLFLIHGPKEFKENFDIELSPSAELKGVWCGYLADPFLGSIGPDEKREELIIGFGAEVDPKPIFNIVTNSEFKYRHQAIFIFSHPAQRELLASADGVSATSFRKSFPFDLQTSKLAILYAGYGTVIERLLSGLPTIFISRQDDLEHERRLSSLAGLPHIRVIKHSELSVSKLSAAIEEIKGHTPHKYERPFCFNAGEVAMREIEKLF